MSTESTDTTPLETHLQELEALFLAALEVRRRGNVDKAVELLSDVLKKEPRLAEPRLELGRIQLEMGRLDEAEAQTREALGVLKAGGQWVEDIPENVLLSLAHNQLAELLRRRAESDEVVFGDPEVFRALLKEAQSHFDEAGRLDPSNEHAGFFAFHMPGEEPDDLLNGLGEPQSDG